MTRYAKHFTLHGRTDQRSAATTGQLKNAAGGYVFGVDLWTRLDRFLVLGIDGGTYYAAERSHLMDNLQVVHDCLSADGVRTVERIVHISVSGRAPKQDPAIFALSVAASCDEPSTRKRALAALPEVCRTGAHLLAFVDCVRRFRGFGRGLRRALCCWYLSHEPARLAYQVIKYQRRGGYSQRDVLRLCGGAMGPRSVAHDALLRWVVAGVDGLGARAVTRAGSTHTYAAIDRSALPSLVEAYEVIKRETDPERAATLIRTHRLTHEMVPGELKTAPAVWEALLAHMPMTALIRSLGKLSAVGVLSPLSPAVEQVTARLGDPVRIRRARLHPLSILVALNTYRSGRGVRGKLSWTPVGAIVDALDAAFYTAFDAITPTGARTLLALDVSGSMACGQIAGMTGVTPRIGSAAMAMATVRTEPNYHTMAFSHRLQPVTLSKKMRIDRVVRDLSTIPMGRTDCALPMQFALEQRIGVDAFVVYTDNETWFGQVHPFEALRHYRDRMGIDAKLIVVGMTATKFSIADPSDAGMLDVVGFDTAAPSLMADFVRGS